MPESEAASRERDRRKPVHADGQDRRQALFLHVFVISALLVLLALFGALSWRGALIAVGAAAAVAAGLEAYLAPRSRPLLPASGPAAPPGAFAGFGAHARALFDELPDAVILVDDEGRLVGTNKAARTHFTGEHAERRYLSASLRRPIILEAVQRVRQTGATQEVDFTDLVPVERYYRALVSRVPRLEDTGAAILVVIRDLTEVKRIEQMRADFIANASHELRTPLSSLAGFIETLRGHARDDAEAREKFLMIMDEQARRMRRLIDDLLSLSRIELNEHVPPSGAVDLEAAAREVANALQPLAHEARAEITVHAPESLPRAQGARDEIVQVLQNLIDNAIKYGRPGTGIDVILGAGAPPNGGGIAGPCVYVSVRDHGEGIAREHIPRLTERFYRVDVKQSRERGGTGLGLAIVKHIVSRHRGKLIVKSELGEGSTFTVVLPAIEAAAPVQPPGPGAANPKASARV
jgi:two-component system phosphate regulon sensor histidine kinase PhoR